MGSVFLLGKYRVNGNASRRRISRRHAPCLQVECTLLCRCEIMFARLVDPETVGLEIGGYCDLRHAQPPLLAERSDDLGRKKMRVNNQVPALFLEEADKRLEVESLN